MIRLAVVAIAATLLFECTFLSVAARAAVPIAAPETSCVVRGFAIDRDPKGSNIRSQPQADAPVIGRLPPPFRLTQSDIVGAEFEIIGSKNGWLLIRNAEATIDKQGNSKRVFRGPGWISGALVGVTLGMPALRTAPNRDAKAVAQLYDSEKGWGPDSFAVTRIHACTGDYVEITIMYPGEANQPRKTVRGWSWKPCATQLTTCDRGGMQE